MLILSQVRLYHLSILGHRSGRAFSDLASIIQYYHTV
jgi:hypothetical protein